MPNISMCANTNCPKRYTCYRYMVKSNPYWQSYSNFKLDEQGKCDAYWDTKEYKVPEIHSKSQMKRLEIQSGRR